MFRFLFLDLLSAKGKEGKMRGGGAETKVRRQRLLTELSRTPLPSVSYSRNMTRGKRENRDPMMTQIRWIISSCLKH